MDLKDFVKTVLVQIDQAVEKAQKVTNRYIKFSEKDNARTVEFDVAVSVEHTGLSQGEAKLKIWGVGALGGEKSKTSKNSTVSRVVFGVEVSADTKAEHDAEKERRKGGVVKMRPPTRLHV